MNVNVIGYGALPGKQCVKAMAMRQSRAVPDLHLRERDANQSTSQDIPRISAELLSAFAVSLSVRIRYTACLVAAIIDQVFDLDTLLEELLSCNIVSSAVSPTFC